MTSGTAGPPIRIDLVSDTATKPSPGMLETMIRAEVGDEQRDEDPTVLRLCERVANLLGKEAALFLPSGTMCNQIAFLVHCRPGDEIIAAANSHVVGSEGAGAAALAGAQFHPIATEDGIFGAADLERAIRHARPRSPRSRLVSVEQTTNRGGGAVWPLAELRAVARLASSRGLAAHMDGARLLNAAVASGESAAAHTEGFDSVWLDLSKGLGCPVGAVLAGSRAFVEDAWRWKHRLGGAMRQAGILAAAGLYALDNNVARLAEDHRHAARLAEAVVAIPGVTPFPARPRTNIVFLRLAAPRADEAAGRLRTHGLRVGIESGDRLRLVTHLGVDADATDQAASILRRELSAMALRNAVAEAGRDDGVHGRD